MAKTILKLSDKQHTALQSLISDYVDTETEIIGDAYNYGMKPSEIRNRCERWNQIIRIDGLNRMQASYSKKDIEDIIDGLDK